MNKKLMIALAGAGALITGALAYHYLSTGTSTNKFATLHHDLDAIGKVQRDPSGAIRLDDFVKIFIIITKNAKRNFKKAKSDITG
jgi:hypothetical protein